MIFQKKYLAKLSVGLFISLLIPAIHAQANSGYISTNPSDTNNNKKPKNIILMIGDGMGISHVYAGMTANHGKLNLKQCTYIVSEMLDFDMIKLFGFKVE